MITVEALTPVEIAVGCKVCGSSDRYQGAHGDVEHAAELFFAAHRSPVLTEITFTGPGGGTWRRNDRRPSSA